MTSTERAKLWRLANPERWKEHQKRYRDKHRKIRKPAQDRKEYDKIYRAVLKKRIHEQKVSLGCSKCGYSKCGAALDWHHVDNNKERRITIRSYFSKLGKIERTKCVLVCANCHREIHEDLKIKENGDVY